MLAHVTYYSDAYKVKGYLGLPPGCPPLDLDALQSYIADYHRVPFEALPVELVAASIRSGRAGSTRPAAYPALVYCRGGVGGFGRVRPHWVDAFASRGFVCFAPCYRGNEGGEGRDEFGGADREDVHAAIRLLRTLPFVDASRITLLGFSRGSINAALTAAAMPDDIRGLIVWGGVADLARTYEERVDLRRTLKRILGGTPARRPEAFRERSPLHLAERLRCPTLVVHGTVDVQVDVGHGLSMVERLRALDAPVDLHLYEGLGHILPYPVFDAAVDRLLAWADRPANGKTSL
ncbi:S9 family peptidase [Paenibacillus antri]|uniref:S9 family peptidase n=1 Tax=Paenibacillus antri TaxID=2582848 RepID=A0A5R9G3L2_9BACL|nr:prolyl oligopeptidase family serine peptidase [Paenibacillus antri]TLS50957.1 S9 family peptidase [Paenibacillus antri]